MPPSNLSPESQSVFRDPAGSLIRLLENLPTPLVVGTLEQIPKFVFMNREYVRLFGYELDEVPTIAEWMPLAYPDPKYREEILSWWFEALKDSKKESGLVRSREVRIQSKNGREVYAILNAIVLDNHVIVAFQDISSRIQRLRDLENSNARMQLAAEAAKVGFWEYDFSTEVDTQDEQIRKIYGLRDGEEFGVWEDRVHREDLQPVSDKIQTSVDGKSDNLDLEFRIVLPGGSIRWIRSRCRISRDEKGRALRMRGIEFDITAEKEAAQKLEAALDRSEKENEAKGRFLTSVSHEIRTPLSALVALTNSMLLESEVHPLPPVFQQHLESARVGGQYLNFMLANILDLSAIERGSANLRATNFYLADWVEDLAGILSPIARSRQVRLEWGLPTDAEAGFCTDQFRLSQIALNLGHNAVKFSTAPNALVSISVSIVAKMLRLAVSDNGPGIDPERLPGLFDEFTQGTSALRPGDRGIGLGLAIVKRNVEILGGTVSARENLPLGTVFEVSIPWMGAACDRR